MAASLTIGGLLLVGLTALSAAQDYGEYPPPARQLNLRRLNELARRMDRLFEGPRSIISGSYLRGNPPRGQQGGYDSGDVIGVRGNFDDLTPSNKPGSSEIAPRARFPLSVMEDQELGPPMPPTQWQMMVSPFITLLPDISEYCQCRGMANCGCCMGFMIKPLGIRNNLCMNVTIVRDAYSSSQYMVHVRLHFDTYKIIDISVSEKQPPMACLSVPPFSTVAGCLQLTDIHRDPMEEKVCTCLAVSLQFKDRPVITLPSGCLCLGKPVPNNKKRGLFGLDFGSLFGSVQDMLFGYVG